MWEYMWVTVGRMRSAEIWSGEAESEVKATESSRRPPRRDLTSLRREEEVESESDVGMSTAGNS